MKLDPLGHARFPSEPSAGFRDRVLAAARADAPARRPIPPRPSWLPELLDGIGWVAAVWVCGMFAREVLR